MTSGTPAWVGADRDRSRPAQDVLIDRGDAEPSKPGNYHARAGSIIAWRRRRWPSMAHGPAARLGATCRAFDRKPLRPLVREQSGEPDVATIDAAVASRQTRHDSSACAEARPALIEYAIPVESTDGRPPGGKPAFQGGQVVFAVGACVVDGHCGSSLSCSRARPDW